ncbi:manganese catalase family protein [Rathayibacter sp. AY2B9]|uniref:manganese catalase family protein n=1 Tax=Rathayibacter sp. AY2B9 TaxID=2080572 RepID=UPI000CE87D07|nr:manganese catalase family protein [Rathayibacter sp. AY2B9]PPG28767.1 manganese catalase [Rathayibacter sp. AY2B9]
MRPATPERQPVTFFHRQELQFTSTPSKPDAVFARRFQEVLGGQYGEITVAMQYGFQAWNAHDPGKYRDLLFGIGAEEFGHVEMIAVMIAQLLEKAPVEQSEDAMKKDPVLAAVIGGSDVQHAIVAGAGARPVDSMGNPWQGSYITASGNLLADFTANANAEMQGRLQVARLYHMTDDHGVRDLLSFLLARDTMHQNQWIAAAAELRAEGREDLPVPSNFPISKEERSVSYEYINFSDGAAASEGSWASGPTPDGKGEFSYRVAEPGGNVPMPPPTQPDERLYGTDPKPNIVEKAVGAVKDAVTGK